LDNKNNTVLCVDVGDQVFEMSAAFGRSASSRQTASPRTKLIHYWVCHLSCHRVP